MSVLLGTILAYIIGKIGWYFYRLSNIKQKLAWVGTIPGWPLLGNALEFGDSTVILNDIVRLIKQYGKIIYLEFVTQPNIFTTDYDLIEFVLSTQVVLNKSDHYRYIKKWLGSGLLTSDAAKWRVRRRIITPAFHFSILEQFVEAFESNGNVLMEKLKKEVNKDAIDIYPFITLYALDIICETAMGISIDAQKKEDSQYVKNVKTMGRIGIERATSIIKTNDLTYMLTSDYYLERRTVKQLHDVTNSVIDARRKELGNKQISVASEEDSFGRKKKLAFLDILLQSTVDGKPLSIEAIREEVDTFMFEGHDTTASAMTFAIYLLSGHPEVQKRALEEQMSIFADDIYRKSSYNDLQEMKYLECVIKEALRLYPSVPLFARHTHEDVVYKGKVIPKGVNIVIFSYGVLRDPDNFKNPNQFDPSRFEETDGKRPYSFIPFSAGSRNCIGQKFAMLEMKSTLSKMLRNFELLPTVPEHKLILAAESILKSKNGVKIRLATRKW